MRKFLVGLLILFLTLFGLDRMIQSRTIKPRPTIDFTNRPPLIGDELYRSNRFTKPETDDVYHYESTIDDGYERIAKNNRYELYVNRDKITFIVKDLETGYIWRSALDHDITIDEVNVARYANLMQSSFSIQYYVYDEELNNHTGGYVRALQSAYLYDSEIPRRRDETIIKSKINRKVQVSYTSITNGIAVEIDFTDIEIGFRAEVTLNDTGLNVHIPNESIREGIHKIANIYVMPFFGAARENGVPGYMFIPDGVGALIRFQGENDRGVQQIIHKYYGTNHGVTNVLDEPYRTDVRTLSVPVYGMVHGVNQNGFLAIIEDGSLNSSLVINPSGALNIRYHWLTPLFILRENYNLYGVNTTFEKTMNTEDITVQYNFLRNEEANYVGMAKNYQAYLASNEMIHRNERTEVPLRLEILASDSKNGLFGPKLVPMTNLKQANHMITDLQASGVDDFIVIMRGWNDGGVSGLTPYSIDFERKVGSTSEFKKFIQQNEERNIPIYFYNDYVKGYEDSKQVRVRSDVAKSLQRIQMEFTTPNEPVYDRYYFLYPFKSVKIAKSDKKQYKKFNIRNLALDSVGHTLFSYYYNRNDYKRQDSVKEYQRLLEELRINTALYRPNAYMWQYTNSYLDMPLYSSQFIYYSDTVPFLPIVLKGYLDYYAPFSNFSSNAIDEFLLMVDYGAFPSYIVTGEPAHQLKYTNSNEYYSTEYDVLKDRIKEHYQKLKDVLTHTLGATIEAREVVAPGVVKVVYSNQVEIWINYTTNEYISDGIALPGKDVVVRGGR